MSARALGALYACVLFDVNPTSNGLREHFRAGGRHVWDTCTAELVQAGFLERKTYPVGNRLQTECRITQAGRDYILAPLVSKIQTPEELTWSENPTTGGWSVGVGKSNTLFRQSQLDSLDTSYKLESKIWSDEVRQEYQTINVQIDDKTKDENMPYDFFESNVTSDHVAEREADLQKAKAKHDVRKREAQEKKAQKIIHRQDMHKSLWTCADIAYEFSYRLEFYWNIPPWSIKSTKFIQAIGANRSRLELNGEIEFSMLDMFFDSVNFEKYTSAEPVWRLFIARGDELAAKAKGMVRTEEDLEEAVSQAKKSQEWLYE